ncbi:MAG: hypothetical protein AAFQ82_05320, partial [Myxococcota bacterium]
MSETEVCALFGPFASPPRVIRDERHGWFDDQEVLATSFQDGALVSFELDPLRLPEWSIDGMDLLSLPTLDAVARLAQENRGVRQAQGGSLYYEELGVAILQFETCNARSIMMWAAGVDHHD